MSPKDQNVEIGEAAAEAADGEGFEFDKLKEVLGFVWRAPLRRPKLAATACVVVVALGLTVAFTMPSTYNAQVKLFVQRNAVLNNPNSQSADSTRNVAGVIMRRDNLVALIQEANLIERFYAHRSAALRLKDRVFALMSGPPTEADKLRSMIGTLERRLVVYSDDTSATISVDWSDPNVAYELVTLVQKNFVEGRYDSEVTMIKDTIAVLKEHAKTELEQVDSALANYQQLSAQRAETAPTASSLPLSSRSPPVVAGTTPPAALPPAAPDPTLTKALEDKRRQIQGVEDEHRRELAALKQQLTQAQLTLTPMHPTVIALQQKTDALSEPPPELAQLRSEERALMAQIAPPPTSGTAATAPARPFVVAPAAQSGAGPSAKQVSPREDPSLAPARERLDSAIRSYQEVMGRIDSQTLELDFQRTAVRYRYSVQTAAEVPRSPKKPIALLVGIGSVLGAILVALLSAATADWLTGRVLETWQVRRRLKLEVLGEFDQPG
jgi:hypothetical protein